MGHHLAAARVQLRGYPHGGQPPPPVGSRLDESPGRSGFGPGHGARPGREALAVSPLDGEPQLILKMPDDTPVPFWLALLVCVMFVGLLVHAWWLAVIGALGAFAALVAWLWPSRALAQTAGSRP